MGGWKFEDLSFIKVLTSKSIMPSKQILTRLNSEYILTCRSEGI